MKEPDTRPGNRNATGDAPTVSVVVPFFNRFNLMPQVIRTVSEQTLSDWELIVVDDCSTEDITAALEPFSGDARIRLLRLAKNGGPAVARNRGVDATRGRYVAFLDSDDQWFPEKLERQVRAMDAVGDEPAICATLTKVVMPGGWLRIQPRQGPKPGQCFAAFLYRDNGFAQTSSLLLPAALARSVRFEEGLHQYEDHLYFMELMQLGARYVLVPDVLTIWHNDERHDRLSSRDDLERGLAFLARSRTLFTPEAEAAFRIRVIGAELMRRHPLRTTFFACRALVQGAVTPRQVFAVLVRKFLPVATLNRLRRRAAMTEGLANTH